MRTLTCAPEIEVIGENMLFLIDHMSMEVIEPLLEKHGLDNIDPEAWYPAQDWLNVINELLAVRPWSSSELVTIGMSTAECAVMPPELENASLEQILGWWNDYYQSQHRGGDVGDATLEKVTDNHIKVVHHRHLYPDALIFGLAHGWASRFLPEGTHFGVYYDEYVPRLGRGGTETILHVEWD